MAPLSGRVRTSRVGAWWRSEFDYQWMPQFLEHRQLLGWMKWMVAAWCGAFTLLTVSLQFGSHLSVASWQRVVLAGLAVGGLWATVRWPFAPWPDERRSLWFVSCSEIALTGAVHFGSASGIPLAGSGMFIVMGMYITLMHSSRIFALHLAWSVGTIAVALTYIDWTGDASIPTTVARLIMLFGLITAVPATLHVCLRFLGEDARFSHRDPLTDLLNRRGLASQAGRMLGGEHRPGRVVLSMVIDLDDFKSVNDRLGHRVGDQALCAVAQRLTDAAPGQAVLARLGGDEFAAIIVTDSVERAQRIAVAMHSAADRATDSPPITASSGAWIRTGYFPVADPEAIVSCEIHQADLAMYEAKNSGGDQLIRHCNALEPGRARHRRRGAPPMPLADAG